MNFFKKSKKKANLIPNLKRIDTVKTGKDNIEEDNYLIIDEKNNLEQIDEYYTSNIELKFKEYKQKEEEKSESTKKIIMKFFEKVATKFDDTFNLSINIAKNISKNKKIEKDLIETQLNSLIDKAKYKLNKSNILNLNLNICKIFGTILCYAYSKMEKYKIKDIKRLVEIRKKIVKSSIDILKDFINFCKNKKKDPKKEKLTKFCKDNKKKYDCIPEIIFLINKYANVTSVKIDINSFAFLKHEELPYFEITILNIYWLLNSLNTIILHFIPEELEKSLCNSYNSKLEDEFGQYGITFKINSLIKSYTLYNSKWNFNDNFKINYNLEEDININSNTVRNFFSHKSFDLSSNSNRIGFSNTMNILKKNTFMDTSFFKKAEDDKYLNRLEIVTNYKNIFEIIFISLYSLNNSENNFNLELVMNDCLNIEFIYDLKKIYEMDWLSKKHGIFHIFDLILYNNIMERIEKFNIEINTLNPFSFDKLLHFLYYNHTLTSFNLSLFSADISYLTPFIYQSYDGIFKNELLINENEDCTYLFNDIKDFEEKMINHLSVPYIYHLAILFHLIKKKKNLIELGFNLDIPLNIVNKRKYMNAIFKFILNILFYVTNTKIKKFCLLSPNTLIDCRSDPDINYLISDLNINNNPFLEDLSLQMQFYKIVNVNIFISQKLKILNIGELDLISFKSLCYNICTYDFNKNSSLERLSIGLMNSITNFTFELKVLFEKLFKIKLKNFISLNIFTNIEFIDKYQYLYLLKILNKNWISEYTLTFNNRKSQLIINENQNEINKLYYLVSHNLEVKLLEDDDLINIKKNPKSDVLKYVNKNLDKYDESYWYLKYLLTKVYTDNLKNEERTKQIIFDILKYVYFIKTPKIYHHPNVNKNI